MTLQTFLYPFAEWMVSSSGQLTGPNARWTIAICSFIFFSFIHIILGPHIIRLKLKNDHIFKQRVIDAANERKVPPKDPTRNLFEIAPSYIASQCHALIVTPLAFLHLHQLWDAPLERQMLIADIGSDDPYVVASRATFFTGQIFLGYFLVDTFFVLYKYPRLGGASILLHHLSFITAIFISWNYSLYPFPLAWLAFCEISTIFLNVRWWLKTTGWGDCQMYRINLWMLAISFVGVRVVLFWLCAMKANPGVAVTMGAPKWAAYLVALLVMLGGVLNIIWASYIVNMLFAPVTTKIKSK